MKPAPPESIPPVPPEVKAAARKLLFGSTLREWKPTPKVAATPEVEQARRAAAEAFAKPKSG